MIDLFEPYYMNQLAFPLRGAAHDVYVFENIDELVNMRFNGVSARYANEFSLTSSQWQEVLNSAILTRICQVNIGKHLDLEELVQLDYLLKVVLCLEGASSDEVIDSLEEAPKLQQWYFNLRKSMRHDN